MRTEIPLLQNVRVAKPCHASWDDMARVDGNRVRFCDGCRKRVYNLSEMGQAEAEGLLRAHEGHLCVRYYRRHDGTILTSDCPVGLQAARDLFLTRSRVSAGLCFVLCVAFAAHGFNMRQASSPPPPPPPPVPSQPLMGAVAPKLPPPPPTSVATIGETGPAIERVEVGRVLMGKPAAPVQVEMGDALPGGDPPPEEEVGKVNVRIDEHDPEAPTQNGMSASEEVGITAGKYEQGALP